MINQFLQTAVLLCMAVSVLLLLILASRSYLRQMFGASAAYQLWLIPPLALSAMLLPHEQYLDVGTRLAAPAKQLIPFVNTMELQAVSIWPTVLLSCWLLGSLALLVLLIIEHVRFIHSLGPLSRQGHAYLASARDNGPAVVACPKPKIILPADFFERYTEQERDLILLHEQVHLRRGDLLANAVFALLQCLLWFNPLVHIAARCFRLDQELACDASVIAQYPQAKRRYAEAMLKTQLSFTTSTLVCHWPSQHPLKERIMQLQKNSPSALKRATAHAVLVCLCSCSAYAAWAATPVKQIVAEASGVAGSKSKDLAGDISYSVATEITVGGETSKPRVVVKQGELASIRLETKNQAAKWDIGFSLVPAPADKYKNAVTIVMVVKKDGALVAEPKLITGLGQTARLQKETPEKELDFNILMTASLVKKADIKN